MTPVNSSRQRNSSLRSLNLRDNGLGEQSCESLAEALGSAWRRGDGSGEGNGGRNVLCLVIVYQCLSCVCQMFFCYKGVVFRVEIEIETLLMFLISISTLKATLCNVSPIF